MFNYDIEKIAKADFQQIVNEIPFFKRVQQQSDQQYKCILEYSSLFLAKSNETVIRKGEFDAWCYYVLSGSLDVFPGDGVSGEPCIAQLQAGDMLGALALLQDLERNATVRVSSKCEYVVLLGIDFAPFGDLDDFEEITLETKIAFYNEVFERLKRRITHYIKAFPDSNVSHLYELDISFKGIEKSLEHLEFLNQNALKMSEWLESWNLSIEQVAALQFKEMDLEHELLSNIEQTLWHQHKKVS
jgi:hypothetical protein